MTTTLYSTLFPNEQDAVDDLVSALEIEDGRSEPNYDRLFWAADRLVAIIKGENMTPIPTIEFINVKTPRRTTDLGHALGTLTQMCNEHQMRGNADGVRVCRQAKDALLACMDAHGMIVRDR